MPSHAAKRSPRPSGYRVTCPIEMSFNVGRACDWKTKLTRSHTTTATIRAVQTSADDDRR